MRPVLKNRREPLPENIAHYECRDPGWRVWSVCTISCRDSSDQDVARQSGAHIREHCQGPNHVTHRFVAALASSWKRSVPPLVEMMKAPLRGCNRKGLSFLVIGQVSRFAHTKKGTPASHAPIGILAQAKQKETETQSMDKKRSHANNWAHGRVEAVSEIYSSTWKNDSGSKTCVFVTIPRRIVKTSGSWRWLVPLRLGTSPFGTIWAYGTPEADGTAWAKCKSNSTVQWSGDSVYRIARPQENAVSFVYVHYRSVVYHGLELHRTFLNDGRDGPNVLSDDLFQKLVCRQRLSDGDLQQLMTYICFRSAVANLRATHIKNHVLATVFAT